MRSVCRLIRSMSEPELMIRPDDFALRYDWAAGSMPPPHHYEYRIEVEPDGNGKITFCPDYPFPEAPLWIETFTATAVQLDNLYRLMVEMKVFSRAWRRRERGFVGGSREWLSVTAVGHETSIPSALTDSDARFVAELYQAIRTLVPEPTWSKLSAQRQEYEENYSKQ